MRWQQQQFQPPQMKITPEVSGRITAAIRANDDPRLAQSSAYLSRIRNAVRLAGRFEEQKRQEKMRTDMRKVLSAWSARYFDLSIFAEV